MRCEPSAPVAPDARAAGFRHSGGRGVPGEGAARLPLSAKPVPEGRRAPCHSDMEAFLNKMQRMNGSAMVYRHFPFLLREGPRYPGCRVSGPSPAGRGHVQFATHNRALLPLRPDRSYGAGSRKHFFGSKSKKNQRISDCRPKRTGWGGIFVTPPPTLRNGFSVGGSRGLRPKSHGGMRLLDEMMTVQGVEQPTQALGVVYANGPKKGGICGVFP